MEGKNTDAKRKDELKNTAESTTQNSSESQDEPHNIESIFIYTGNLNVIFEDIDIEKHFGKSKDPEVVKRIEDKIQEIEKKWALEDKNGDENEWEPIFEYIPVSESIIGQNHFTDGYLDKTIYAHFHITGKKTLENLLKEYAERNPELPFTFPDNPFDYKDPNNNLKSYAPIELTIFRNGAFCIILRGVANIVDEKTYEKKSAIDNKITIEKYLETIDKPEYLKTSTQINQIISEENINVDNRKELKRKLLERNKIYQDANVRPGYLLHFVHITLYLDLMPRFLDLLNQLELKFMPLDSEIIYKKSYPICPYNLNLTPVPFSRSPIKYKKLEFQLLHAPETRQETPNKNQFENVNFKRAISYIQVDLHEPYVGTYYHHVKKKDWNHAHYRDYQKFAIAAGRTTKEYYKKTNEGYLLSYGDPPQNILHPRDDIIYFTQRGFSIIRFVDKNQNNDKEKNRSNLIFRTAVVETLLISIEIIKATAMATQKFEELLDKAGREFNDNFAGILNYQNVNKNFISGFTGRHRAVVLIFSEKLKRLRRFLSINESMINLESNVKTHSAQKSIQMLDRYTHYKSTIESAKKSLESHTNLLITVNQFWQDYNLQFVKAGVWAAIISAIIGLVFNSMPDNGENKFSIIYDSIICWIKSLF